MSKMNQVYGLGQALISSLPPPQFFESAPTSTATNYEVGQIAFTGTAGAYTFYIYAGDGVWDTLESSNIAVTSVSGTANQVTSSPTTGAVVLSTPSTFIAPGSVASTTTMTAGTGLTVTSGGLTVSAGGASITGNSTVTGNLTLGAAGNKLLITTGSNASCGVSGNMSGTPGAVTVSTNACTASSVILFSRATTGGTPGQVSITAQSTSGFTLTSTGNETSTFNWLIIN